MSSSLGRNLLSVATILVLTTLTCVAQMPGKWLTQQKFAPVPNPEEEYWNTVVNGKLYMMGGGRPAGRGNPTAQNTRVLEYDIAADKWTTKKPAPWPANHMALAGYQGKVYVANAGDVQGQPNTSQFWEYDPAADSW
jgi:hypothetical protein